MKKEYYLRPLYTTLVIFILSLLGIVSDIAQVFDFNVYVNIIKPNSPHSYIYLILFHVLLFLTLVVISFHRSVVGNIPESDLAILDELGETYSSSTFYGFREYLEEARSIHIDQIDTFESYARRYSEKDKALLNKALENKKNKFLTSLLKFIDYTDENFNTIANPNIIKFFGGKSEYELMTSKTYAQEEKNYLRIAKEMYDAWNEFHQELRKVYPDYIWKK